MVRNRIIALLVSLGIHSLIFLGIYFMTLKSEHKVETKEINLVPVGVLKEQPRKGGLKKVKIQRPTTAPRPKVSPIKTGKKVSSASSLVSDQREEKTLPTPPRVKEPKESPEEIALRKAKEAAEREKKKREKIKDLTKGAFSKKKVSSQSSIIEEEGDLSESGDDIQAGFSLAGRSISGNGGFPARPKGFKPIRGTIVVAILVNDKGNVIKAERSLRGSNITDPAVIRAAIRAAKETHFNSSLGAEVQRGTITYHFDIQ